MCVGGLETEPGKSAPGVELVASRGSSFPVWSFAICVSDDNAERPKSGRKLGWIGWQGCRPKGDWFRLDGAWVLATVT